MSWLSVCSYEMSESDDLLLPSSYYFLRYPTTSLVRSLVWFLLLGKRKYKMFGGRGATYIWVWWLFYDLTFCHRLVLKKNAFNFGDCWGRGSSLLLIFCKALWQNSPRDFQIFKIKEVVRCSLDNKLCRAPHFAVFKLVSDKAFCSLINIGKNCR